MAERRWRIVPLRDVPSQLPAPDDGVTPEERKAPRARGDLLFLPPEVVRVAVALETPTVLCMAAGRPGAAYRPPIWASDWRPPADWLAARRAG